MSGGMETEIRVENGADDTCSIVGYTSWYTALPSQPSVEVTDNELETGMPGIKFPCPSTTDCIRDSVAASRSNQDEAICSHPFNGFRTGGIVRIGSIAEYKGYREESVKKGSESWTAV